MFLGGMSLVCWHGGPTGYLIGGTVGSPMTPPLTAGPTAPIHKLPV